MSRACPPAATPRPSWRSSGDRQLALAGVPFYLRTGKRLQQHLAEIAITFDDVPLSIFPNRAQDSPNQLVIQLQPDESITLTVLAKAPGDAMRLRP